MNIKNYSNIISWMKKNTVALIAILGVLFVGILTAYAYTGGNPTFVVEQLLVQGDYKVEASGASLGAASFTTPGTNLTDLQVDNDLHVLGDAEVDSTLQVDGSLSGAAATFTGAVSANSLSSTGIFNGSSAAFTGEVSLLESNQILTTSSTLLTASSETIYLSGAGPVFTLPATSTIAAGASLRFVVNGALSATSSITTSGGADIIEGALIVAGAVVDCDAEDTINFVGDGENIGDFVELRSDGNNWYIGASSGLTSAKLTCTKT